MKTFEEKYTAWLDGQLPEEVRVGFERELGQRGELTEALAERERMTGLRKALCSYSQAPALENPDFFNHQIMHRIAMETPVERPTRRFWALPRLVWAGLASLVVAVALFKTLIPASQDSDASGGAIYFAEIVDVRTSDPSISATPVYDAADEVTVLWLEGLDYLPDSYHLQ